MTKTQLLHILFGGAAGGGFRGAHSAATEALDGFEGPVWRSLASSAYWSGFGQADAVSVAQTNTIALHVARTQTELGGKVVDAASTAFSSLASSFADLNDYAKSRGMWITESGTVVFDENNPNYRPGSEHAEEVFRKNIEFAATNMLKLATLADQSAAASLDSIRKSTPKVVVTVLDDTKFIGVDDVKAAGIDDLEGILRQKGITLSEDLGLALSALGQTPLAKYLHLLQGDVPAIVQDGVQWGLERAANHAGFGSLAEALAKTGGKFLSVIGWTKFAGEVAVYLAGKVAPDGLPSTQQVVDQDGKVRAVVFDERLYVLGQQFYSTSPSGNSQSPDHVGTGNLADLALQQRLNGIQGDEPDYVAEAEALRANLKSWLDGHPGTDTDTGYARSLLEELDTAIGYYGPRRSDRNERGGARSCRCRHPVT